MGLFQAKESTEEMPTNSQSEKDLKMSKFKGFRIPIISLLWFCVMLLCIGVVVIITTDTFFLAIEVAATTGILVSFVLCIVSIIEHNTIFNDD